MFRETAPPTARRPGPWSYAPIDYRSSRPPYQGRGPDFPAKSRFDRPPGPARPGRPNFVVELLPDGHVFNKEDVEALIEKCTSIPNDHRVCCSSLVAGSLYFRQWMDALEAMISFWEWRFDGVHNFVPRLISNVLVPSDSDELKERLRKLFAERIRGILHAKEVDNRMKHVSDEIAKVSSSLRQRNHVEVCRELVEKRNGLIRDRELIGKRVREFRTAMNCILNYLEGRQLQVSVDDGVEVFKFCGDYNWRRIYKLVMRETTRLESCLPIYAFRQEILHHIHCQQILILIGETGSGKSTQLVQFLADSEVAAAGTIVCTQPRKIAAISLAHRVTEESRGCYDDNSIVFSPSYLSANKLDSKVIFMTDHCLLQQYMNDNNLTGVSCIIVDEAHERSLNTDLLLAMIKKLLHDKFNLRLIIMSATADAKQLSEYFYGCGIFHVVGRNFPIDIQYVPYALNGTLSCGNFSSYVSDVIKMASDIHQTEKEGTILAFLTSQVEVEWACECFRSPSAISLPLHGRLSLEDQFRVFQNYPGRRKVIFATNIAETSLTIPGVKYVVDSGMVKESKFDPATGMNVLKVCKISQSSANQRAGRAGRMESGKCFRLYPESDIQLMPPFGEPEIRRVHLGIAVLRILALGIKNVREFDFVDAPSATAIDMAVRNLIQLGAVTTKNDVLEISEEGRYFVKLGIEPRLGKLILSCFNHRLCREGLVLAAVMTNASSIFCRVGSDEDKRKSDRLKVQFCHRNGDLFTLLSVYKVWEGLPPLERKKWCWENSINAKSMRRCEDTVAELENCLKNQLHLIVPSYWSWNPNLTTDHDQHLKQIILSAFSENVAMYSGYDQLGYEVALNGQHVQLHPSSSLLVFTQKPSWVVFGELLSASCEYLVCVTAIDFESLLMLSPPLSFDISKMESRKLDVKVMTGFGNILLKKFCGKSNSNLRSLISRAQTTCEDKRIAIEVNVDQNEVMLFACLLDMEKVFGLVNDALMHEQKWLQNECVEKYLYNGGPGILPSFALFGAGAQIRHLELEKRSLCVDVFHPNANAVDDKELLMFIEKHASVCICTVQKFTGAGLDNEEREKWGRVTFLTPDDARRATELNNSMFCGSPLKVLPSRTIYEIERTSSFPAVRAKVYWPRRHSKGSAIIKCEPRDVDGVLADLLNLHIGGKTARSEQSRKYDGGIAVHGLDKELSEAEILDALRMVTDRTILDFFLVRGDPVHDPPCGSCEEALLRELTPFMPKRTPHGTCCRVQVFAPEPKDAFMRAIITFDGRLHLEAAKALEGLEGKVLPGCLPWQKIKCQRVFHTSVHCPAPVYGVIRRQLDSILASFEHRKGAECHLERNENGSYRVKIAANATRTAAQLRRPLEQLTKGRTVEDAGLTSSVLQHLFSKDGIFLMRSLGKETGTYILFDRHTLNLKLFGPSDKVNLAQKRLVQSLLTLHESKQLEIHLRGGALPPDLLKEVVKRYGPDLQGFKEKVPGAELTLNIRRQVISVSGTKEMKRKVEEMVCEMARASGCPTESPENGVACPICLCEVEDRYALAGCGHAFCRLCLVEQCESAMKSQDSFPILCAQGECRAPVLLTDLRSLLSNEKLEELFRASLGAFVASSGGAYRFCSSPDCPSVYRVAGLGMAGEPFVCGACFVETCTRCHVEYHPYLSCERYREFKEDPDSSLKEWCKGKEHVKTCPVCGHTIEKVDGCNHVECRCGSHICWVCLEVFRGSENCYDHLRSIHLAFM